MANLVDISKLPVKIDFFSVTISTEQMRRYYLEKHKSKLSPGELQQFELQDEATVRYVFKDQDYLAGLFLVDFCPLICTDADWYPQEKGLFNYKKSGTICRGTTNSGKYAYGDNGGGFFIQLTGNGCNGVNWYPVYNLIKSIDPDCHVTRIDFAHDDYEGQYSFEYWDNLAAYDGFYAGVGRKPNINRILNSDQSKGNTLDVGSKQTGKQIEVYEKGKQLGLGESPWVRVEVRYTSSGTKDLPLEMMLNPAAYFLGANKALMVLNEGYDSGVAVPPPKIVNELKVSLDVLVASAKRSYGKLVRTMKRDLDMSTDKIVSMLEADKDGLPKRMNNALYS